MPVIVAPKHSKTSVLLFAGVMLIAVCLRAPVTNVGPLLEVIRENLHLSPIAVGILPTLPLFTFGAVSLLSGYTRYLGIERSLFAAMCLLTLGLIVRSLGSEATLFAGTIMLAAGIAIANVLLPSVIKRDFPKRITLMTTLYVTLMGTVAALFRHGCACGCLFRQASHAGSRQRSCGPRQLELAGLAWHLGAAYLYSNFSLAATNKIQAQRRYFAHKLPRAGKARVEALAGLGNNCFYGPSVHVLFCAGLVVARYFVNPQCAA